MHACGKMKDHDQAMSRFDAHVNDGGEVNMDSFNMLFKSALEINAFAQLAGEIKASYDEHVERGDAHSGGFQNRAMLPNAFTEQILRRTVAKSHATDAHVAHELLVQFGFEKPDEIDDGAWMSLDERAALKRGGGGGSYVGPGSRNDLDRYGDLSDEAFDDVDRDDDGDDRASTGDWGLDEHGEWGPLSSDDDDASGGESESGESESDGDGDGDGDGESDGDGDARRASKRRWGRKS